MRFLHHHGRIVGWQMDGGPYRVPMWLYRLSELRARCPGGKACDIRSEVERLEHIVNGRSRPRWRYDPGPAPPVPSVPPLDDLPPDYHG